MTGFKLKLARLFIKAGHRLGPWVQNIPAAILAPEPLVALTRAYYSTSHVVDAWTQNIAGGLIAPERLFLKKFARGRPRVLILGCGAGREALILARRGMRVTAVDYSRPMLENLKRAVCEERLEMNIEEADILRFKAPLAAFDLVFWGSNYGRLPTRAWRVSFLKKASSWLTDDGRLFCYFLLKPPTLWARWGFLFHRFLAFVTRGNGGVEIGDEIRGDGEFLHHFGSSDQACDEIREAGFVAEAPLAKKNIFFLKKETRA